MNIPSMPQNVEIILEALNKNGYEGYIVGGCVRDSIMGKTPHDWDIATSATPLEIKEIFEHTVDTGIRHGTVTVVMNKENYEITTYRIDGEYRDLRHPSKVSFTRDLHEDLLRRDFTVNSIAYAPKEGYVDIFGGICDIEKKLIRGVGDARQRFQEDALRMFRSIRFSVQLDFDIEETTFIALKQNAELIKHVSVERIREELTKTICGLYIDRIGVLWESGLLNFLYPKLQDLSERDIASIKNQFKNMPENPAIALSYAVLLQYLEADDYEYIVTSLKFDTKTKKQILSILNNLQIEIDKNVIDIRKLASKIGTQNLRWILEIKKASKIPNAAQCLKILNYVEKEGQCISIKQLKIDGDDIFDLGVTKGTAIGEALNYALDIVMNDQGLNEKSVLLEKIKNKFL